MSRRGRSGPTISLFSFQDIITSVTAIVTVITLLLALDLVQRKQSKAGDSSGNLAVEQATVAVCPIHHGCGRHPSALVRACFH